MKDAYMTRAHVLGSIRSMLGYNSTASKEAIKTAIAGDNDAHAAIVDNLIDEMVDGGGLRYDERGWLCCPRPDTGDKVISSEYGDPRLRTPGLNPYRRYPERSTWTERETREREDGSRYKVRREVMRWCGEFSYGEWVAD